MIIKAEFLSHWKTKLLIKRLGDGPALTALISLWAYCEQRRAWQFSLTPLELAGVCDYGGDPQTLFDVLVELRFFQPTDPGEWIVNGWGEMNAALVQKWPGRKMAPGEFYHPKGFVSPPIPQAIAPPLPQPIAQPIARAIREDRIGEEKKTPCSPPRGAATGAASSTSEEESTTTSSLPAADSSAKKRKGRRAWSKEAVEIYEFYPRKVGRDAALRAIQRRLDEGVAAAELMAAAQQYGAEVAKWPAYDRQYAPHPATWFNQGRFADDPSEWARIEPETGLKKEGAAPLEVDARPVLAGPPAGYERAMAAVFGAGWEEWSPGWYGMTPDDRAEVVAWVEEDFGNPI